MARDSARIDAIATAPAPTGAGLTPLLRRYGAFGLGALLGLTVPAFWPSYFFPPAVEADYHVHFHGISMFVWMILLVAQASLIRAGNPALHRAFGKLGYVAGPAIIVSTILLTNHRLKQPPSAELLYFFYLQLALLAIFTVCWLQALRHRREPALHMRYMIGTALAAFDPIVARVLYNTFGTEPPFMQLATFAMIDAILLALILRESGRRGSAAARVFPRLLALFVAIEIPLFFLPQTLAWKQFATWYGSIPMF
jgi:uncharacterized membrane protein